jgi:dihydroneopterin aldolase
MQSLLYIELKDLQLFGQHGWHAEEALTGNTFTVNIRVQYLPQVAVIRNIDQTINYATIYHLAKTEFAKPQALLETVAMLICERIYGHFPQVKGIWISIYKMAAPIPNFSGTVGITYEKEFD